MPPIDFEKLRKEKIEKLIQSKKAQWINCNLKNFDLELLVEDPEQEVSGMPKDNLRYFDVLVVDPPWDIHMTLPYETLSDT